MSKIICDVCGTSYPESATQCPICGCVRPSDSISVDMDVRDGDTPKNEKYTYVKGGRFSKSNVKKRNKALVSEEPVSAVLSEQTEKKAGKGDKGLVIAVCVLLLAIIAVVIYIAVHFFAPQLPGNDNSAENSNAGTVQNSESTTAEPTFFDIPCTEIILSKAEVTLNSAGAVHLLNVTTNPTDTTDEIVFTSADENVATVSNVGKIEAVGPGETTITVTCGSASAQCSVVCNIETEPPETTISTNNTPESYTGPFKISKTDVTIKVGETFLLKLLDVNGTIVNVTWSVDNSSVCTVNGNSVTGTAAGTTKVTIDYEGETYACIVRVIG